MKDYEKVVTGLKQCLNRALECEGCPYEEGCSGCMEMKADALNLIEELKARLEQPTTMPNYEAINRKLEDQLCRVNVEYERTQHDLAEAQKELTYLRGIKATAEAFLGRSIGG